ncbi:hypothetical protein SAMN05443550_104155 [Pedobacter hartonius]|uniref:Uncharacterized protein n=2 Tax=Pedobacter hartonius TaxID=425514 RepID=A0A1H4CRC5_9SPHI|nr:hypothetical protein SAMN05443550_104155 [Pedobacter hartonius]
MAVTAGIIILASCAKEVFTVPALIIVSEEDMAESIICSVASSSNGITAQVIAAAHLLENKRNECGIPNSDHINYKSDANQLVQFLGSYKRDWLLSCDNDRHPAHFSYSFTGNNAYDAPNMSSDFEVSSEFNITGLEKKAEHYNYQIDYTESGDKRSKVGKKNKFSSSATYKSTNITVNKSNNYIESGTIAVTLNNTNTDGSTGRFDATIVFSNNHTATLTFGNGTEYTFTC